MHSNIPKNQDSNSNNIRGFFRLWPYLWPTGLWSARLRFIVACAALLLGKIVIVIAPLLFKELVDTLEHSSPLIVLPLGLIAAYTTSRFLAGIMNDVRDAVFARVSARAVREAGGHVFRHLHNLSLDFHLSRKMGALNQIVQRGVKSIEDFMQFSTFSLVPTLIEVILTVSIFCKLYGGLVGLISLLMVVIYIYATFFITEWRIRYIQLMNTTDADANARAIDSLINFETVKYFNNEALEANRYDQALTHYEEAVIKSKMSLALLNGVQNLTTGLGLFTILWLGCDGMRRGFFTLGDIVAINTYLLQLFNPLFAVGFAYRQVRIALVNMTQMFDLLDVKTEVQEIPNAKDLVLSEGEVTFSNVSFHYNVLRPILKDISFTVPSRKVLAIVGASGAGKSTISKLLYRFYDVTKGSITIDGQDIRTLTQQSVRHCIGIVPQDTVLFNDSLEYNIRYGRPESIFEEIVEAAKKANIHRFIESLPEKYATIVGERGLKLSGGEKQRVSIARALLKNPSIFVFDEATSSLDTHTEREIQKQLEGLAKNHTTIIIAHRLSTVIYAHHIIVLQEGEIVEEGTHKELLQKKGLYASLWERQSTSRHGEEGGA